MTNRERKQERDPAVDEGQDPVADKKQERLDQMLSAIDGMGKVEAEMAASGIAAAVKEAFNKHTTAARALLNMTPEKFDEEMAGWRKRREEIIARSAAIQKAAKTERRWHERRQVS